ncbi:MAG: divergent polysaccharide deacetylase family protein [Rhodospirillaceae bacterium]
MDRKSSKYRRAELPDGALEKIPETGGVRRQAAIIVIAIILVLLGVTIGVVVDVVVQMEPEIKSSTPIEAAEESLPTKPLVAASIRKQKSLFSDSLPDQEAPACLPPFVQMEWNAVASAAPDNMPAVAIVIDDMGLDRSRGSRISALPAPLTLSFLTYADDLLDQSVDAREAGHEVLAHIPMEPLGSADPGPGALTISADPREIKQRLDAYLENWSGYVGINNHMGSKLTGNQEAMNVVIGELCKRGLLWLDSRTDAGTVGEITAATFGLPYVGRDVFIDNINARTAIDEQLRKIETIARTTGQAVAIGHPRDNTILALSDWLPSLKDKGINLVPITEVVRRVNR